MSKPEKRRRRRNGGCKNRAKKLRKKLTLSLFHLHHLHHLHLKKKKQVIDHAFLFVPAQSYVAKMIASLKEFPPRQEPASFSIDRVMEKLKAGMPVT